MHTCQPHATATPGAVVGRLGVDGVRAAAAAGVGGAACGGLLFVWQAGEHVWSGGLGGGACWQT